ncbi:hypothetical protein CIB84_012454 [Bambusicola thoracicus]|uniref:Uncharacterized protein n=1 Tax=Bambusicola thoracicus TaxID=9083 RepID=A0A2P4SI54_BAMTH|nr:hypothetical protein CIB84_012454 [Bambusicola thoracicus]
MLLEPTDCGSFISIGTKLMSKAQSTQGMERNMPQSFTSLTGMQRSTQL